MRLVPALAAGFVAPYQQDRAAARIKSEQGAIGATRMLSAQLSHV
ncbi:hypothetical protein CPter291_3948 [Collimonas pratensis]|uniref:Uncharacterized protein n=1 Tax=Collimonas pratensis TaxID=279113 RepID=A0ABM5ZAB1_9BURK|nr:hypothetical protein CPter291_3948 [Collimonas pratensis]